MDRDELGFEDEHDSIRFILDSRGYVNLQRPDADRFKRLMEDEGFQSILSDNFDRALQIVLDRFESFG
jgi:hypothetical protein